MSSVTSNTSTPQAIANQLASLRRQLMSWLTIHGAARWLAIVIGIVLVDILIDRTFQMDRPQRMIMLVVMLATAAWFLFTKVIRPLLFQTTDDALVAQIERQDPHNKQQILSAIQLSREPDLAKTGTSRALVDATVAAGIEKAGAIDFSAALDSRQNQKDRGLLYLSGAAIAILVIGVLATSFLGTWFSRNVMLSSAQWPQPTYLTIAGAEDGKMVLPLGSRHKQIVTITEDSAVTDVNVNLEVEGATGNRTIYPMAATGKLDGRERVFEINVTDEFRFRASTGNSIQTDWVEVTCVQPPAVVDLELQIIAPPYAQIPPTLLTGSGPFAVLEGSQLTVKATSNKSLASAELMAAGVSVPMPVSGDDQQQMKITVPGSPGAPENLTGGEYLLKLTDQTGLENIRRSKFVITLKEDQPPKIRADLLGISGLVTTRAILPMSFQAADDYGLNQLFFDCRWRQSEDDPVQSKPVYFDGLPNQRPVQSAKDVGVLELEPLNLQQGTSLTLTLNVEDTRPSNPNVTASKEFLLRIVSDEELRSDLLRREIEQRKSFEQIYQAQQELMSDVQIVAATSPAEGADLEKFNQQREAKLISMIRDQKGIGTSVDRIANRFEDFLVEVKNNRLDEAENELAPSQRIETRFDERIIRPLREMDQNLISIANRNMDNCRRLANDSVTLNEAADQTVAVQQQILETMRTILGAMNNSENFQEIINEMLNLKASTKSISSGIKKLKSNQTIESEADAEGIFDD